MSLLLLFQSPVSVVVTGTATWEQPTALWDASAAQEFTGTAAFLQAPAAFDAVVSESIPAIGAFEQGQEWAATVAQSFRGTAAFEQSSAAFDAVAAEQFSATGEWDQPAATWQASDSPLVSGTAAWSQSQVWDAATAITVPSLEIHPGRTVYPRRHVYVWSASFGQAPASWVAEMSVNRSPVDEEELLLVGAI
jgi:hypothetical protein